MTIQTFYALPEFLNTLGYDIVHNCATEGEAKQLYEKISKLCSGEVQFVITYNHTNRWLLLSKREK